MAFIWYFLFYSWLGFLLEVVFARLTHGKKRDRKCMLLLPLCPVYGVGAVGILLLPQWVQERPLALVLGAALVCPPGRNISSPGPMSGAGGCPSGTTAPCPSRSTDGFACPLPWPGGC